MKTAGWTYGAELEFVDWNRCDPVCKWDIDLKDVTLVNSNGIAVDPLAQLYHFGGEALTQPSNKTSGVIDQMESFLYTYPDTNVNYKCDLHVHVRVPGLREDLSLLKRLQKYCSEWLPTLLPIIELIPEPERKDYPDQGAWKGARKRYARRKISQQHVMSKEIVGRQMKARTVEEFLNAEALHVPSGKLYWATKPRCAVNIRQLVQTDTVEFRHFPGTKNLEEASTAVEWVKQFMMMALSGDDPDPVKKWNSKFANRPKPQFYPYVHWMELCYQKTAAHIVGRDMATKNIREILNGEQNGNKAKVRRLHTTAEVR